MPDERVAVPLAGQKLAPPGTDLVVVEWKIDTGGSDPPMYIAPLHLHHNDDEAWYVLEGVLRFRLGDEEVEAEAGGAVMAPRGTVHTFWNPRPEPCRYVLVMTARISALIDALHAQGAPPPDQVFREHDSELIGWP
jgi:mannose-6-phosphate isomerase-like protein (cupin superfamily)